EHEHGGRTHDSDRGHYRRRGRPDGLEDRPEPLGRRVRRQAHDVRHRQGTLRRVRGRGGDPPRRPDRGQRELLDRRRQHRHPRREARRAPPLQRLLRRRRPPQARLHEHPRRARPRADLQGPRRPDDQGGHPAGRPRRHVQRLRRQPLGADGGELVGDDGDRPRGVGDDLQLRPRGRRRPRRHHGQGRPRAGGGPAGL
ncbi:MAG: hypothetical protein AVDCRST_MAG59-2251, partial [uncultured Thermomicrobiales bacterium]